MKKKMTTQKQSNLGPVGVEENSPASLSNLITSVSTSQARLTGVLECSRQGRGLRGVQELGDHCKVCETV